MLLIATLVMVAMLATMPAGFQRGDFDQDGDCDGFDYLIFSQCYSMEDPPFECVKCDMDQDGDLDQRDWVLFAHCYNGSNRRPKCFIPQEDR